MVIPHPKSISKFSDMIGLYPFSVYCTLMLALVLAGCTQPLVKSTEISPMSEECHNASKNYHSQAVTDYMMASAIAIEKRWKFCPPGRGKDLESIILIQILSDGTIDKVHFDTQSGDERFDASILQAVQSSNPLQPFANLGDTKCIVMGLRFKVPM